MSVLVRELATGLRIGGETVETDDRLEVRDPATGEVLAEIAAAGVTESIAAVDAADRARAGWADTPPRQRAEILRRAFELMIARRDAIAELIVRENGKTRSDATGEVNYAAEFFRWYSEEAVRIDGGIASSPAGGNRIVSLREPIGVSLLVTPWNFPAAMATRKIGPALAAGCPVVLKPASDTPLTALLLADLLAEAGVPAGVVNVVPSRRSGDVVSAMLHDPRVRALSFTGSTQVGRILLHEAADRVVRCSMELGGNAPFVVLADADLEAALDGAFVAKMRNGGQSCIAANRFLVHESLAAAFSELLAARVGAMRLGPGLDPDSELGPLINETARADIAELVSVASDAGATVLTGGRAPDRPGWFYEPTVLGGLLPDDPLLGTELFGPIAPITTFADDEEVIAAANATEYGLAAYVYGEVGHALRVAEALESGMVGINRGFISDPAAPFGGVKESGLGREGGHDGLLEFLETKYIAVSW